MPPKKGAATKATTEIETDTKQNHVSVFNQGINLIEFYSLEKTWWRKPTTNRNWTVKSKEGYK